MLPDSVGIMVLLTALSLMATLLVCGSNTVQVYFEKRLTYLSIGYWLPVYLLFLTISLIGSTALHFLSWLVFNCA